MINNNKKHLAKAGFALIMASLLTSCDYSDFSFFGLFYKRHIEDIENGYKGSSSSEGSDGESGSGDSANSSQQDTVFVPQTYVVKKEDKSDSSKTIETYEQLTLVDGTRYLLAHYSRSIAGDKKATYDLFSTVGSYQRTGNTVTLSYEASVYASQKDEQTNNNGIDEASRKQNIKSAFGSDTNTIALNKDGSFSFGKQSDISSTFTGSATAKSFYTYTNNPRPVYNVVTLIDDKNYFLSSFAKDSADNEKPVSALIGMGTYKKYDIKDDSIQGEFETVRIDKGYGYMFAMNGTSPVPFDLQGPDGITQWYGMSFGSTRSIRLTDTGYKYSVESGIEKYDVVVKPHSFQVLNDDVDTDPAEPVKKETYFSLQGKANQAFTLDIYKDGTYEFQFTTYKVKEDGTWAYNKDSDTLVLTAKNEEGETKTNTFSKAKDSEVYSINYVSLKSDQMTQEFEVTQSVWDAAFGTALLGEFKGDANSNITLQIYDNGSYSFNFVDSDRKIDFHEKGSWEYSATKTGVITVTLVSGEKSNTISATSDGNYKVDYVAAANAGLTQTFTISKDAFRKTFPVTLTSLKGEKKDAFLLNINTNGTYTFQYSIENQGQTFSGKEEGTYAYDSEKDEATFSTTGKTNVMSKGEDGNYKVDYVSAKNAQLSQTFVMDPTSFASTFKKELLSVTGLANQSFSMTFYGDGSYKFTFAQYHVDEFGTYAYDGSEDKLVLTCQDKVNYAVKDDSGNYKLSYVSKKSDSMKQDFTITATDFRDTFDVQILKLNGASGKPIDIYFYSNRSYLFSFEANGHKVLEKGSWEYDETNDQVVLRSNKKVNTLVRNGDNYTMSYVAATSNQITQNYSVSKADFDKAFPVKKVSLAGKKLAAIQLFFYTNGTYCFYWERSNKLIQEFGIYSYDKTNDTLTLYCKDTVNTFSKNEDGSYSIAYQANLNPGLNQSFDMSKEQYQQIIA